KTWYGILHSFLWQWMWEVNDMRDYSRKEREVWQACETLWENGLSIHEVTGEKIAAQLVKLGFKKGSNTDLYRYKRTWLTEKNLQQENTPREEPASDRITRAASLLREEVLAEIQEEQETFKARLEAELEQVKNEL